MNGLEPQRLFSALTMLVMALFVAGNVVADRRWRGWLRRAAIAGFAVAAAAALVQIAFWSAGY